MNHEQLREANMVYARINRLRLALEAKNPDECIPAELKNKVWCMNTVSVIEDEIRRLEREFEKI